MQAKTVASCIAATIMLSVPGCGRQHHESKAQEVTMHPDPSGFRITSPAFGHEDPVPPRYTADGANVSPELRLEDPPSGVVTFALVMDDPDAPRGTWVHWVAWNVAADTRAIAEGGLPEGAATGRNSWGRPGYGGPSPPSGTHRYFFKVYALDTSLELPETADKAALERAMEGHIIAEAVLMGTYTRR